MQHLVFNIALRVEVVERTRHKEDLIQLNVFNFFKPKPLNNV